MSLSTLHRYTLFPFHLIMAPFLHRFYPVGIWLDPVFVLSPHPVFFSLFSSSGYLSTAVAAVSASYSAATCSTGTALEYKYYYSTSTVATIVSQVWSSCCGQFLFFSNNSMYSLLIYAPVLVLLCSTCFSFLFLFFLFFFPFPFFLFGVLFVLSPASRIERMSARISENTP